MRTIFWVLSYGDVSACKVLFATEQNLLVRSETGAEFLLEKDGEGAYWFTTREEAEAEAKKRGISLITSLITIEAEIIKNKEL